MGKVITFGNAKGGVGKTTTSTMVAYLLAKKGYKTLMVDLDPQANATSLMLKTIQRLTGGAPMFETTLMQAINEGHLGQIITPVNEHLDLLPSFTDFTSYPNFLNQRFSTPYQQAVYFSELLDDIKGAYDFVIIDTPPTISIFTDSALMASDEIVIVMQTQERSLDGAAGYVVYLNQLLRDYGANYDILGIVPVLLKNRSQVDASVLERAKREFGEENLFENVIQNSERLKRYDVMGIGDPDGESRTDQHDVRVFGIYERVVDELLERLGMRTTKGVYQNG